MPSLACESTAASGTKSCEASTEKNSRARYKKYQFFKIAFVILIILMCLVLAICQPLRVYALGFASEAILEFILSSLAGTAAAAFLYAGGAELLLCLIAGMAASITVSTICAAINTAVECGAWDDFVFNCKNNFEVKKENGSLILNMGTVAFGYAYLWVKEHIFGIKDSSDPTQLSFPQGEYVDTVHVNSVSKPDFSYDYENHGFKYTFSSDIFRANNCFSPRLNILMRPKNNEHLGVRLFFGANFSYNGSSYDSEYKLYEPVFTAGDDGVISSITDHVYVTRGGNVHTDRSAATTEATYIVYKLASNNKDYTVQLRYNSNDKQVTYTAPTTRHLILTLSDGSTKENFNSINEFITDNLYNSIAVTDSDNLYPSVSGVKEVESPAAQYYEASKDLISTTADSVNKKIAAGDITDENQGSVAVKVGSLTNSTADVTGTTAISSSVGVTDISSTETGVNTMTMNSATVIGSNNLKSSFSSLGDKLPFSAMKSISTFFNDTFGSTFEDSAVPAPVIPVTIDIPFMNKKSSFNIDFSSLQPYIGLVRAGISVEFIICLYLSFKKWIVNKAASSS